MSDNKIREALKTGKLIAWEELFASYSKKRQEAIKRKARYLLAAMELRKLRRKSKLSQAELAHKMHVKREFLSRIESGRQNITLETLFKIAEAVGKEFKFSFK